jgi:predicted N-acetyltransferase YhbS
VGPLSFRPADPADVPALVGIVNGAYRGDASGRGWTHEADLVAGPRIDEAGLRAMLARPRSVVLVALREDALVGCVHVEAAAPGECFLGMLSVRVVEQGSGLGKALVAAAEDHARRAFGARVMAMHVVSVRPELLAWYERRGYRRTGHTVAFEPQGAERSLRGPLAFERLEKRL